MKTAVIFLTIFLAILSTTQHVFANGGNIRLAEGKYLVNISSAPVTPVEGEKVEMLISFADIQKNELLPQDLRVWIEVRFKSTEEVIFPQQEFRAERGVLDFDFTYPKPGLHELFVRFEKPDEPGKIYETEDFLVDVQPKKIVDKAAFPDAAIVSFSVLFAGLVGFFLGICYRNKSLKTS